MADHEFDTKWHLVRWTCAEAIRLLYFLCFLSLRCFCSASHETVCSLARADLSRATSHSQRAQELIKLLDKSSAAAAPLRCLLLYTLSRSSTDRAEQRLEEAHAELPETKVLEPLRPSPGSY